MSRYTTLEVQVTFIRCTGSIVVMLMSIHSLPIYGISAQDVRGDVSELCGIGKCSASYDASFFTRYAPVTALDMINNLPGFSLQNGDSGTRGFGAAAGNVLVNGERISTKSESASDILARIPAADVSEIILIRGQTAGLDLQGQTLVANVIRRGGATGAWSATASLFEPDSALRPAGEVTYSDRLGPLQFTASLSANQYQNLIKIDELLRGPGGELLERRDEVFEAVGEEYGANLNASVSLGDISIGMNAAIETFEDNSGSGETSFRTPLGGQEVRLFQGFVTGQDDLEIGLDVERSFGQTISAKLIGLYRREDYRESGSLVEGGIGEAPEITQIETTFNSLAQESIGRLELDYSGLKGHLIEASMEGAVNTLDSDFQLFETSGGVLVLQNVPGATTEVKEERLDARLSDAFKIGPIAVEAALGVESSTITQTGGFEESRSFLFWKPSLSLNYARLNDTQLRLRFFREVGQLDFFDFVSNADLDDNELALGNPALAPETTITAEATYERQFGEVGVVRLIAFHDWIDDVQDIVPLEGELETPGNIGKGTRAGIRGELTLPLDGIGLAGGRIDARAERELSSVTDPLTGEDRALSGERGWEANVEFRQDLTDPNLAWGATLFANDNAPGFGIDELEKSGERFDADAFIEIRAIKGLVLRIGVENIFRDGQARDRQVFAGQRNISPLDFRELREESFAREWFIEAKGTF